MFEYFLFKMNYRYKWKDEKRTNKILKSVFRMGSATEDRITGGRITGGRITEGRITEGRITEGRITEGRITEARIH